MFRISETILSFAMSSSSNFLFILLSSASGHFSSETNVLFPIFSQSSSEIWGQKETSNFIEFSKSFFEDSFSEPKISYSFLNFIDARLYEIDSISFSTSLIVLFTQCSNLLLLFPIIIDSIISNNFVTNLLLPSAPLSLQILSLSGLEALTKNNLAASNPYFSETISG